MGNAGGTRRSWKSTPVIHRAAGSRNKEAIRRSEPIIIRWQPTEAAEQVFVCLVFFLQTIIKAVRRHRFSCHDYLHVNLTSSMWRQIISSLIRSKANCDYFLKKTLLFMRKLLSTNWVFHEFSLGSQAESCFYYLLPLYNQLFNGDDSFQPRKSNVFFFKENMTNRRQKMLSFPWVWRNLLGFAIFSTNIHTCAVTYAPNVCRQGVLTALRAMDLHQSKAMRWKGLWGLEMEKSGLKVTPRNALVRGI